MSIGTRARYRNRTGVIRMCAGVLAHIAKVAQASSLTPDERSAYKYTLAVMAMIDQAGGLESRERRYDRTG